MADRIIIGADRLPTIEILGTEYPYDVTSPATLARLEEIVNKIDPSIEGVIDLCKTFYTTVFCGNEEPAERIGAVYKDSAWLWLDAVAQLTPFILSPKAKTILDRMSALKRASTAAK